VGLESTSFGGGFQQKSLLLFQSRLIKVRARGDTIQGWI